MFSGIVEAKSPVLNKEKKSSTISLQIQRPPYFDDIEIGDSICVSGVCLTVENLDINSIFFSLGPETLAITEWDGSTLKIGDFLNLERSLRLGDRIHGHFVTGHVDGLASVENVFLNGEALFFSLKIPEIFLKSIWKKGSLAVNGVSLTINNIDRDVVSFYLIPETLKSTNLSDLKIGQKVNIELDMMSKAVSRHLEARV